MLCGRHILGLLSSLRALRRGNIALILDKLCNILCCVPRKEIYELVKCIRFRLTFETARLFIFNYISNIQVSEKIDKKRIVNFQVVSSFEKRLFVFLQLEQTKPLRRRGGSLGLWRISNPYFILVTTITTAGCVKNFSQV